VEHQGNEFFNQKQKIMFNTNEEKELETKMLKKDDEIQRYKNFKC
jgi:hypothetical protein